MPRSALGVLQEVAESFREKPIAAIRVTKLTALQVRQGLEKAARAAETSLCLPLPAPVHGPPLVIFRTSDLEGLAAAMRWSTDGDEMDL